MKGLSLGGLEGGALLAVAAGVFYVLHKQGVVQALTKPGALNPGSSNNVAYVSTNAVGAAATGDPNFTLGGWLYDIFNPPVFNPKDGTGPIPTRVALGTPTGNGDPYGINAVAPFGSLGVGLPPLFKNYGDVTVAGSDFAQVENPAIDNPTFDPFNGYANPFAFGSGA